MRKKGREISSSVNKLTASLARPPEEEEIAAELQISLAEYQSTIAQLDGLYLTGQVKTGNVSRGESESVDLIESAPSEEGHNPFDLCLKGETKARVAAAVSQMSEREQLILSLYYQEEMTMREISEIVGIVVARVSQIHSAVLVKLRAALAQTPKAEPAPPSYLQPIPQSPARQSIWRQA